MPSDRQILTNTDNVGIRLSSSRRLTYSRVSLAFDAKSSWVIPAFNLALRIS